ncbi:hypothetical protein MesoLj113a_25110 [Mesorhizobium sp. 113-1-2]|uniref:hypothetical protein n=1 Tax=Mesorhizobium sp. 113-1-2 TaxID=2744515 RepID=UPI0019281DA2|nr:hypothetical protein [Mesorhizobium sp. 113-1-2]BCG71353.1 hypothetical protein MesoLj113a_25110 [Mesorhizobium sp. 113-1-2]
MRNTTVAALVYEFLFDVYWQIDAGRPHNDWLPDEHGVMREAFYHMHMSCWEWSTSVLEEVGAIKTLQMHPNRSSPYSYPLMTLDECRVADFSEFETFDNYCYAMFTFRQLIDQTSAREDEVNLAVRSPQFLEAVASKDDVFPVEDIDCVKFRRDRFEEKVMTRWRDPMQRRIFQRKDGAQK